MKGHIIIPLILLVLFSLSLSAQTPESELELQAKEYLVFVSDAKKEGNCEEAATRLKWMFDNAPKYSKNLYIKGAQIYDCLADATDEITLKQIYMDSTMLIYDLRVKHFGQRDKVMNYKATTAYKYFIKDPERYDQLWQWFSEALALNGAGAFNSNLIGFADLIIRYDKYKEPLTLEKVMPIYDQINNVIDLKLQTGKEIEKIQGIQANVDAIMEVFFKKGNLNCSDLAENFGRRFDQNLDNINFAKTFFRLLRAADCRDNQYYLRTAIAIFEADPSYPFAVLIARQMTDEKDYAKAEHYFDVALDLTEDNTQLADVYLSLGELKKAAGDFSLARSFYQKTIAADPSSKEKAYTNIGDLYYHSSDQCKLGKSKVQDRAVYFAAFEMYQKAGNRSRMELAQAQFPLGSEIHMDTSTQGLGEKITVGCWINIDVTIRKRDGANN